MRHTDERETADARFAAHALLVGAARRAFPYIVILTSIALAACAEARPPDDVEPRLGNTCGGGRQPGPGGGLPSCDSACTATAACGAPCVTSDGTSLTCGDYGYCRTWDTYCAYPIITD